MGKFYKIVFVSMKISLTMKRTLPVILLIIQALRLSGQEPVRPGSFSGSFESTSQIYQKDTAINAMVPQDRAGSNNYLKLDYYFRKLSAGIQVESYLPSLAGYPVTLNQTSIINRYLKYTGEKFSLQAGDFYEQFGSGLIFRSWENRQIGINNAVEGINIQVYPSDFLKLKAVYGRQRKGFERAASNIRGFDAAIDLSKIKRRDPEKLMTTQLGFSYVTRYQEYTGPDEDFPSTVNAFSTRMDISHSIFSLSGEYVFKTKDPQVENSYSETPGMGLLVNGSLAWNRAGMTLSFRSLKNMYFRGEREATGVMVPVNYIPALTRHHA